MSFALARRLATAPMASVRALSTATPSTLTLPDARILSWYTSGRPDGAPVLFIHGTPDSGLAITPQADHEIASRLGVRWLGPDRPGFGLSSPHPGRTPLDWADDVRHLLDHLGIDRVRLLSMSGGTPSLLA